MPGRFVHVLSSIEVTVSQVYQKIIFICWDTIYSLQEKKINHEDRKRTKNLPEIHIITYIFFNFLRFLRCFVVYFLDVYSRGIAALSLLY